MNPHLFRKLCPVIILVAMIVPSWSAAALDMTSRDCLFLQPQEQGSDLYDLLIIAPRAFHNELLPLVKHKNSLGIRTVLVDLDEVYDRMFWQGRDEAEKVKYFIN